MEDTSPGPSARKSGLEDLQSILSGLRPSYVLETRVGAGSMGVVYRARHRTLGSQFAIKLCTQAMLLDRFEREAKILARLNSAHVVTLHDYELLPDGRAILMMEWVDGENLEQLMDEGQPMEQRQVLDWMVQVCHGMEEAAANGVVHRDLKPSNVLIDQDRNAKICDFGVARSSDPADTSSTAFLVGTPLYMAPEQAEDPRRVDTRADIYSFGATFYHVLTGRPPFVGESAFSILYNAKTKPLVSPRSLSAALDVRLSDCLERCLAKAPHDRFESFAELGATLSSLPVEPWDQTEDLRLKSYFDHYRERRSVYLWHGPEDLPTPDKLVFPSDRTLTVGFGNLVEQRVDAIVSSDDETLWMGGSLGSAILVAGGLSIRTDARKFALVRRGRAIVTDAGRLPARFVMHAVTIGREGDEWVWPSPDLISEIMESCFYHADTLGVRSIAFPLLGTGGGGLPRDECLDAMFRFLARKLLRGLTCVSKVRVVLHPLDQLEREKARDRAAERRSLRRHGFDTS